jgi:hypothetical protein
MGLQLPVAPTNGMPSSGGSADIVRRDLMD